MATKTTNYNLIKPALEDDADIRVINGNMDVLDNQLKSISDKASNTADNAYNNLTVSSDYTWKFTKGSGANASYDTIKKATTATAMGGTTSTYKVPTDASKYGQLEYWFGKQPYKGSSTNNIDGSVLKFNHFDASNWNSALFVGNNSYNRPYMAYQDGTAGEYSVFKELAWYDDTTNKLPLAGGTMTGAIKTADNIYKNSNNGTLVLSGSTDSWHGGRIDLSGEKQTDAGLVKITADNGGTSYVTYFKPNGYTFNGVDLYTNTTGDILFLGSPQQPKLAFNRQGDLTIDKYADGNLRPVVTRYTYTGDWWRSWVYETNDLLIQGGIAVVPDSMTNITLPRPYGGKTNFILYVSDGGSTGDTLSPYAVSGKIVSNTTIALRYFSDRYVNWLTIGGRN